MAHLYTHLRVHQIFGANTDVGKTIFATGLCIASELLPLSQPAATPAAAALPGERTFYFKPVQTGPRGDWDAGHIHRFSPRTHTTTLHSFPLPLSPHVAAAAAANAGTGTSSSSIPTDAELAAAAAAWLASTAAAATTDAVPAVAYVEAAGGVHSPSPAGTSLSAVLRPLRLPTILIGSAALGGISTTRSAYDSLLLAGYDVQAILLFPAPGQLGNVRYLRDLFHGTNSSSSAYGDGVQTRVFGIGGSADAAAARWGPPPERAGSQAEDDARMRAYYHSLVHGRPSSLCSSAALEGDSSSEETPGGLLGVVSYLRMRHAQRIAELHTLASRTRQSVWWPFTQHTLTKSDRDVTVIDSASADCFDTLAAPPPASAQRLLQPTLDGSASWWTQCVGHAHPRLTLAASRTAARYGHVIFPNAAHAPAVRLAERLLGRRAQPGALDDQHKLAPAALPDPASAAAMTTAPGRGWADRAYFSDDGSTGMEIALKMAIASTRLRYAPPDTRTSTPPSSGDWEVIGLKGSYHGDTIGAMDACQPSAYSSAVDWYRPRGFWFDVPSVQFNDGVARVRVHEHSEAPAQQHSNAQTYTYTSLQEIYDVPARLASDPLTHTYRTRIRSTLQHLVYNERRRFGALVLEPLVMGAGGMVFVDPLFQRCLVDVVRESEDLFASAAGAGVPARAKHASGFSDWTGLPVIFDEVFTGLYRLGLSTPAALLGVHPDISCLAKILTGGLLPMSVTLASEAIFAMFARSERKVDALLHGHSYTAYPIGCEVANETIDLLDDMVRRGSWDAAQHAWHRRAPPPAPAQDRSTAAAPPRIWSFWCPDAVQQLSHAARVENAMALGCVLAVELRSADARGYTSDAAADVVSALRKAPPASASAAKAGAGAPGEQLFAGIHARPLGNVVYLMCSLNTRADVLREAEQRLIQAVI
ncbi:PLP-dependent transferase [Tilletiaria anomala UBC 951]|uniref:PLP-dependent transferase n=1 Tax=Tilletiaria anomala (strain ATCC 24038 / CBS 436.72 / UBC 951) TaxID=1037660 RepID=A0A066VQG6_TILAU|nr:PLP-dependent transferase [Tilletiaria anomala UBC 951]KDN42513.1 PLP-dependent transferase [Tilletiaria anomala UBC 951]